MIGMNIKDNLRCSPFWNRTCFVLFLFFLILQQTLFCEAVETVSESLLAECQKDGMPEEILFSIRKPSIDGHWYANFGHYATDACKYPFYKNSGGKLCIYNTKTKQLRTILADPEGNIRDPQLYYDASKLVFSYLPKGASHYSLYEMNIDGTNLHQLTGKLGEPRVEGDTITNTGEHGGWDDIEPVYCPDDQIIFCSSRANRYVQCWLSQVATVHKCRADGSNIRALSCNVEQDNTPWILNNGQVAYMRWEYVDRNHLVFHHLWTMNPDGTQQMIFYGNRTPGGVFLDAKSVPESEKVVAIFSPGHGMKEHYGRITLFDREKGPDAPSGIQYITKTNEYADPWAFSENTFMAVSRTKIVLVNSSGKEETIYTLPNELIKGGYWIGEPRPVMKRPREFMIADNTDPSADYGTLALTNIYRGRQMKEVPAGTVKELLIYEVLPKPTNYSGAMSEMSSGGTFSVERLLGSVPVSSEGSACFKVPPLRSLLFVALDENGHCVKRMHSFTSVMPGETSTCIGCHEQRVEAPTVEDGIALRNLMKTKPTSPQKVVDIPEIIDYQRDIQPLFDKYCVECHGPYREDGGFNISGHWGPLYTLGYQQMSWRNLLGDNRVILPYNLHSKSDFRPYEIGSGSSHLLQLIEKEHAGVKIPAGEQRLIRFWLDAGAGYAGTYHCNSWGSIGYYVNNVNQRNDKDWPETKAMEEVIQRRCDICHAPTEKEKKIGNYTLPAQFYITYYPPEVHQKNMYLAHTMSEDGGRFNRHVIFDLSYPEQSKIVRAPLTVTAGGSGVCETKSGKKIFADKNDPDYQKIVAAIARGRKYILEENNRFCMSFVSPNNGENCPVRFIPRHDVIREMIQYGLLPKTTSYNQSFNPFELDEIYWKSFHYRPIPSQFQGK